MPLRESNMRFEGLARIPFKGQGLVEWWRGLRIEGSSPDRAIRDILDGEYVNDIPPNSTKEIADDPRIKAAFFKEAVDYFAKGILTFYSSHALLRDNHRSWALISTYYSSFYTINSLLRIQGRAIVHSSLKHRDLFWLCPLEGSPGDFLVKNKREGKGEHGHHWKYFYNLYRDYKAPEEFESILLEEYFGSMEREESAIRNDKTYYPFSFDEARTDWVETAEAFWNDVESIDENLKHRLVALCTDPDHKYFARAALRLLLAKELLEMVTTGTTLEDVLRRKMVHLRSMRQLMVPSQNLRDGSVAWALTRQIRE